MIVTKRPLRIAANPRKAKVRPAASKRNRHRSAKRKTARNAASPTATNPRRKPTTMAKTRPKKKASSPRRSKNPANARSRRPSYGHRRRRNPSNPTSGTIRGASTFITEAITAAVALATTRQLPQMVLQANNTGWIGYGANLATTLAAGYAADKFGGERQRNAALIGGGAYLVSRVLAEQFSPVGQYLSLSGLGDAQAATSLGTVEDAYYPYPVVYDESGNPVIPRQIISAAQAGMMPQQQQQQAAMAGVPSRYVRT